MPSGMDFIVCSRQSIIRSSLSHLQLVKPGVLHWERRDEEFAVCEVANKNRLMPLNKKRCVMNPVIMCRVIEVN